MTSECIHARCRQINSPLDHVDKGPNAFDDHRGAYPFPDQHGVRAPEVGGSCNECP